MFSSYSLKSICQLFLFSTIVFADIERHNDGFKGTFTVLKKGRLYRVIDSITNKLTLAYCLYACIHHLNCKTVNYSKKLQLCELNDMDYDEYEADENPLHDWWNYGTPQKSKDLHTYTCTHTHARLPACPPTRPASLPPLASSRLASYTHTYVRR